MPPHSAEVLQGFHNQSLHHGYDGKNRIWKGCYTFKDTRKLVRFHGFLMNHGIFQVCVVTHYQKKKEDKEDKTILNQILNLLNIAEVKKAVDEFIER